ncbi:hypothetical protein [Zobellia russellii]|uniref:hypothetical protein n=1 Tax=Zobellia russellii TaxID=248907 RepID=UPI001BFEECDB|nr:hypothetical protein [Zobellia russellii]MBT9189143.1 hypothetical protein [Zobellia russellii]
MTLNAEIRPPAWFWIISVIALLWNLMGVSAYLMEAFMSVEDLGKLTQDQRLLYESRPIWVTSAYAIAVWAGALGCIALLLRKKWAKTFLLLSLIGVLAQNVYQFFLSNTFEVYGPSAIYLPIMIIVVSIALYLFAKSSASKGWIS